MEQRIKKKDLVSIRKKMIEDDNFIYATFLRSLYHFNPFFHMIPKGIFMENYHKVVERLITTPNSLIQIACLKEDPEVILGYSILSHENRVLHFLYCKKAWSGIGIGRSLVPKEVSIVTHLTEIGFCLLNKHPEIVFNPFVII